MKKIGFVLSIALCFALISLAVSTQAATPRDVQTFKSSAGPIKITPVMHASVLIEAGGKVIYVDPAKPGDFSGLPQADLILITHDHGDHVDHDLTSIKAISKDSTQIWAPASVKEFAPNAMVVGNGEKKNFDKFTIEVVPAYNLVRGPAAGKFFHPKGTGNGYVITYGGERLYFSGDTEAVPEIAALKNIDVAFVCMNLPYTMTADEAADLVKSFHPKVVIPYHYRSNPPTDLAAFKSKLEGSKVEVRMLEWYPKAS